MQTNIEMLARLIEDQLIDENGRSITVILSSDDAIDLFVELVKSEHEHDAQMVDFDFDNDKTGVYIVSSCVYEDGDSVLIVENIETTDGIVKYDESDVLIMPKDTHPHYAGHFFSTCRWNQFIALTEDTTLEELVNLITI